MTSAVGCLSLTLPSLGMAMSFALSSTLAVMVQLLTGSRLSLASSPLSAAAARAKP